MKGLLKGVVRDHRVPSDYRYSYAQPSTSLAFRKGLRRSFATKLITKQYMAVPQLMFFGVTVPFFLVASYIKLKTTGSLPQAM